MQKHNKINSFLPKKIENKLINTKNLKYQDVDFVEIKEEDVKIEEVRKNNKIKNKLSKKINSIFKDTSKDLYSFQIKLSENIDNSNIAELCKGLYDFVPLGKRLNIEGGFHDVMFNPHQTCFEIDIKKGNINFNIHTKSNPITIENIYKRYYPSCVFKKLDNLIMAEPNDLIIEYDLKEHYFRSLSIDYTHLQPIASLMDLQLILNDDENILYQIILTAADADWGESAEEAKKEFKEKEKSVLKMPKEFNTKNLLKMGITCLGIGVTEVFNTATELIFDNPEKINLSKPKNTTFSNATNQKSRYTAFKTTIRVVIKSNDFNRKEILKHMIDNALSFMDSDNQLEGEVMNKKKISLYADNQLEYLNRVNNRQPTGRLLNRNILTVKEVGKLIMLPTKSLQEKFFVDKNVTNTNTTTLDEELFNGDVRIGKLVSEHPSRQTYYPSNPELYCLPKIVAGGMGSGKSNFTIGYINDSIKMGNTVFQFDYIDECQIATATKNSNPNNHIVISPHTMLNFTYPEVDSQNISMDKKALDFSNCILKLLDTLNINNMNDMTGRMKKTLRSASIVCYLSNKANVKDIFETLTDVDFREELLDNLDDKYKLQFKMYINVLENLTITKKSTGERLNDDDSIKYLLDRFDAMMGDGNLLDMFNNENSNINFEDLLNSGKLVTIELPQRLYRHKWVKDVIVCFLLHRIWIATENRDLSNRKIVDIILDEVHQLSNTKHYVSEYACETRKFRIGFLFCCQYFNQFKVLLESIEGGSVHYIMLQGCKPSNFTHIEPLVKDFTLQNFMSLPKYHAMNVILTKKGHQTFVTSMPKYY